MVSIVGQRYGGEDDVHDIANGISERQKGTIMKKTPWAVTWLTWPILFAFNVGLALRATSQNWNYSSVLMALLITNVVILVTLEFLFPARDEWKMTRRSFSRDLKFIVVGGATIAGIETLLGLASIQLNAGHIGPITTWPLYLSVPAALLTVEFINYWQHRWSHEFRGGLGNFLWRSHAAHHLPQQVYVFMHPAFHPINTVIVRALVTLLPLYYLGASAEAVLLSTTIVTLQAMISHFNVDVRAGWMNYIFVGTELHRFHHSANLDESKNYAVTLSFVDLLFGTFVYRPGVLPERLGVANPGAYPDSTEFWSIMRLPFERQLKPVLNDNESAVKACSK
jgi:sterol desaturase/sphingolipid hydroxylase (fatty acid hydroxylase superfamily)